MSRRGLPMARRRTEGDIFGVLVEMSVKRRREPRISQTRRNVLREDFSFVALLSIFA